MSWEVPLIKWALDGLVKALGSLMKKGHVRKHKTMLSSVIAELLKLDPDIPSAEAKILAVRAVGVPPSADLLRAEKMLLAAKAHKKKPMKKRAAKKRVAKKRPAKKRVAKKRPAKKRVAKKRPAKKRVAKKRPAKKRAARKR